MGWWPNHGQYKPFHYNRPVKKYSTSIRDIIVRVGVYNRVTFSKFQIYLHLQVRRDNSVASFKNESTRRRRRTFECFNGTAGWPVTCFERPGHYFRVRVIQNYRIPIVISIYRNESVDVYSGTLVVFVYVCPMIGMHTPNVQSSI